MQAVDPKQNNAPAPEGTFYAENFNKCGYEELKNLIEGLGITLNASDQKQIIKAIWQLSHESYSDVGSENQIILQRENSAVPLATLKNNIKIQFKPAYSNTGDTTLKVGDTIARPLIMFDNTEYQLIPNILQPNKEYTATYSEDKWILEYRPTAPTNILDFILQGTSISKGTGNIDGQEYRFTQSLYNSINIFGITGSAKQQYYINSQVVNGTLQSLGIRL